MRAYGIRFGGLANLDRKGHPRQINAGENYLFVHFFSFLKITFRKKNSTPPIYSLLRPLKSQADTGGLQVL